MAVPFWVQLDTGGPYNVIHGYTITSGTAGTDSSLNSWTLEGSNDGTTWTTLDTQTGVAPWGLGLSDPNKSFQCNANTVAYRYFRLNVTAVQTGTFGEVDELYLYSTTPPVVVVTQRGNIAYDQIRATDRTGSGDQLLTYSPAPPTATSAGVPGQIAFDSEGNWYWCYAANQWARLGPAGYGSAAASPPSW